MQYKNSLSRVCNDRRNQTGRLVMSENIHTLRKEEETYTHITN